MEPLKLEPAEGRARLTFLLALPVLVGAKCLGEAREEGVAGMTAREVEATGAAVVSESEASWSISSASDRSEEM